MADDGGVFEDRVCDACEMNVTFSNKTNSATCANVTVVTCVDGFLEQDPTATTDRACLAASSSHEDGAGSTVPVIAGVVVGAGALLVLVLFAVIRRRNRGRKSLRTPATAASLHGSDDSMKRPSVVETIMDAIQQLDSSTLSQTVNPLHQPGGVA